MNVRIRRWLSAAALMAGAVALVFILFHDAFYHWVALRALHRFAGVDSGIEGNIDVSHGSPLIIDMSGLRVALDGRQLEGPRGSIDSLHFEIRLLPLLAGVVQVKSLVIRDATFELFTVEPSLVAQSGAGLPIPLIESWTLDNVRIGFRLTESGARNELLVVSLTDGADDDGNRRVTGNGTLDGDPWTLNGELGSLAELLAPTRPFPLNMTLEVPDWGMHVQARGTVGVPLEGKDLQLALTARTGDLGPIRTRLLPEMPFAGALSATARLTGDLVAPLLSDLQVELRDGERLQLEMSGTTPLSGGGAGLDIDATLTARTPEVARFLTHDRVPGIDDLQVAFKARGDGEGYVFDAVHAAFSAADGRSASFDGSLRVTHDEGTWQFAGAAGTLAADLAAQALSGWVPENFPMQGRIKVRATLGGDGMQLDIPSFDAELSGDGPLQGTLKGEARMQVARLHPVRAGTDEPVSEDLLAALSTQLELTTGDVKALGKAFDVPLPDLGKAEARASIELREGRYHVTALDARTRAAGGLQGRVRGSMSFGALSRGKPVPADVKLQLDVGAPSVAAAKPLGVKLGVDLGAWTMQAHMRDVKGKMKLDGYRLRAGVNGANQLQLDGKGGELLTWLAWDLKSLTQASMSGKLKLADTRIFSRELGLKLPDLGTLEATFEAHSDPAGWVLQQLQADITGDQGIAIKVTGSAQGVPADTRFRVDVEVEATGKQATGTVTGGVLLTNKALKARGTLEGGGEKATYKGSMVAGSTHLDTDLVLDISGPRPLVTGTLRTTAIDGADLGWPAALDTFNMAGVPAISQRGGPSLLSAEPLSFDALALADFELEIIADSMEAFGAGISALKLTARNRDRHLNLDVKDAGVAQGQISGVLDIDAQGTTPLVTLTTRSNNLSLHDVHGWLGGGKERMSGRLSHDLQLKGRGRSLKEVLASASGHLRQVILDGQLVGGDLDLLDMRISHLLLSMTAPKNRTKVECMITEFEMVDGIATARKLFVQTPKMRVAGTGTMNFRDETVDLLLRAQRRRFKLLSQESTIEVKGPMAALEVQADVNILAAGTAMTAGVVVAPVLAPVAGLGLLNQLLGGQGESTCKEMGATHR